MSQDGRLCRDTAQVGAGLGVAAGVHAAGGRCADCAQGAGRACVLGVQGARDRLTCMGRPGVARNRRWGAQASGSWARRRVAAGRKRRWATATRRASGARGACGAGARGACAAGARGACVAGAKQARGWVHEARGARPAGQHGRAACAHRLGQLGARALDIAFNLVFRLDIFRMSLNEHCSL